MMFSGAININKYLDPKISCVLSYYDMCEFFYMSCKSSFLVFLSIRYLFLYIVEDLLYTCN